MSPMILTIWLLYLCIEWECRSIPMMLTTKSLCPCVWSVLVIMMRVWVICWAKEIAQIKWKNEIARETLNTWEQRCCQLLEFLTFSLRMRFLVRVACVRTWHAAVAVAELIVECIVWGKIYFHLPERTVVVVNASTTSTSQESRRLLTIGCSARRARNTCPTIHEWYGVLYGMCITFVHKLFESTALNARRQTHLQDRHTYIYIYQRAHVPSYMIIISPLQSTSNLYTTSNRIARSIE